MVRENILEATEKAVGKATMETHGRVVMYSRKVCAFFIYITCDTSHIEF
jgi:hypothetical protein